MSAEIRALPQNAEAEAAVLGSVLLDPALLDDLDLEPQDFYREAHANLWRMLRAMREDEEPIGLLTILPRLQRDPDRYGGLGYVSALSDQVPSTVNASEMADVVRECRSKRDLILNLLRVVERGYVEDESFAALHEAAEGALRGLVGGTETAWVGAETAMPEALEDVLAAPDEQTDAVWSGWPSLDKIMGGFRRKEFVIIAGRPGSGKSTVADNIATALACSGIPVALFSLEMSCSALAKRRLCAEARVDSTRVLQRRLTDDDRAALRHAEKTLRKIPLLVDDTPGPTVTQIRRRIRRLLQQEPGLRVVFIDYFGLIQKGVGEKRWEQMSSNAKELQQIAKEFDITLVVLSQLGRQVEQRSDKRPMLSDLRETGSLEEAADVVLFCYRDDYYDLQTPARGLMEIIVAKNRSGAVGVAEVHFSPEYTRVDSILIP